jgi:hypothetical protein
MTGNRLQTLNGPDEAAGARSGWPDFLTRRLAAVALLLPVALTAAESSQERGKRMIDEAVAALGGNAFLTMNNRVESGRAYSFYREQLSGLSVAKIYTRYYDPAPGKLAVRERENFGKNEDSGVLFLDSGEGWEVTWRGARALPTDTLARYKLSTLQNIFYILRMRLKEPGMIFESRGSDVYDNAPVEIVDVSDSEDRTTTVFFHQTTELPMRQIFVRRDPKTKERFEEVTIFSKYRDIGGGVQWPFAIQRERDKEKIFEMYSESVTVGQKLPDKLFQLPGDVKKLKPAD